MSWFEDLFINEAKPALNGRPSSGGSSEGGNSSGGNSGPCSWNDLTDKPFGEAEARAVLVPETTVEFTSSFLNLTTQDADFKTATLAVFDGVEYDVSSAIGGGGCGNSNIFANAGVPNDMPFAYYQMAPGMMQRINISADNLGTHTFALYGKAEKATKPLDEIYIPDTIARRSEVIPAPATAAVGQTIAVKVVDENNQPIEWEAVDMASGEGGAAIIDVVELPTENINEDCFYRLLTGKFVANRMVLNAYICHCVEALPEVGEPATTDMVNITAYYNAQDGIPYVYLDEALSGQAGFPVGWLTFEMIFGLLGGTYGGVISDINDDSNDNSIYLLLEYVLHSYKDGWNAQKTIGWAGSGNGAEVFNTSLNEATDTCSHAEGYNTVASGRYSHAEGWYTVAEIGDAPHAEGYYTKASNHGAHAEGSHTHAESDSSHAEGSHTVASGFTSHAEGSNTVASGRYSHAEGYKTVASGVNQHVQGRWNIEDPDSKYAHIVGNGEPDSLSNAHTLDWDGNAWFAGGIELTSPNGTRYRFTVSDDGTLSAVVVTE